MEQEGRGMKVARFEAGWYVHMGREEYNATFDLDVTPEAFEKIVGESISWKNADEIIVVDPETHEKAVFRRVKEGDNAEV